MTCITSPDILSFKGFVRPAIISIVQPELFPMQKKLLALKHRHFVFSIPKEFRKYFRYHRALLNVLFSAVHDSFTHLIQKNSKKQKKDNWTHGMISVMHTYGRYMKWNPHIHALVAERVYDKI